MTTATARNRLFFPPPIRRLMGGEFNPPLWASRAADLEFVV